MIRAPRRCVGDDRGAAMIVVMASMVMITGALVLALYVVLSNAAPARTAQDSKAAYAAARAGIDEYLARLNASSGNYWTLGNNDPSNPALTPSGQGRAIPGAGSKAAHYRYQVLNVNDIARTGQILLRVTGMSAPDQNAVGVQKTLTAVLKPVGYTNYVYFTDQEVLDPSLLSQQIAYVSVDGVSNVAGSRYYAMPYADLCDLHYYAGRGPDGFDLNGSVPAVGIWDDATGTWASAPGSVTSGHVATQGCTPVVLVSDDVFDGKVHTNDVMTIWGAPTFLDVAESSWPYCQTNPTAKCWIASGTPASAIRPTYAPELPLPVANTSLKDIAMDQSTAVGCVYTGATRITFTGTTMKVLSPNTTSAPLRCLNTTTRSMEQTVQIPSVIYLDSAPGPCTGVGYPMSGEDPNIGTSPDYACDRGTAFLQGVVGTQVTVASLDDIVVTGDLTYATGMDGTDMTGLIAGNHLWIYHPVDAYGNNLYESDPNVKPVFEINAAMMSLRHSYVVQNWYLGTPISANGHDQLIMTGSIAQKFKGVGGIVTQQGVYLHGITTSFYYDKRLDLLQPPYFLQPVGSPWSAVKLTDG